MESVPGKRKITVLISGSGTNLAALIKATQVSIPPPPSAHTEKVDSTAPSSSSSVIATSSSQDPTASASAAETGGAGEDASVTSPSPPEIPNAEITHVVSNRKAAYGLTRAAQAGIRTSVHSLATFRKTYLASEEHKAKAKTETSSSDAVPETTPSTATASSSSEQEIRQAYDASLASLILAPSASGPPDLIVLAGWMHILSPAFLSPFSTHEPPIPLVNLHPALPGQFNGAGAIERAYAAFQAGEIDRTGVMAHYVIEQVDEGEPICWHEVAITAGETLEQLEDRMHRVEWGVIVEGVRKALQRLDAEDAK
jgi:phosphoribosylglycinamide formyltransferase